MVARTKMSSQLETTWNALTNPPGLESGPPMKEKWMSSPAFSGTNHTYGEMAWKTYLAWTLPIGRTSRPWSWETMRSSTQPKPSVPTSEIYNRSLRKLYATTGTRAPASSARCTPEELRHRVMESGKSEHLEVFWFAQALLQPWGRMGSSISARGLKLKILWNHLLMALRLRRCVVWCGVVCFGLFWFGLL